jgi:hypothetical protein
MADLKISQLTGASTPLAGTEVLPLVQSGTTKKVAVSDLTAGRAVNTGQLTATNASGGATAANYLAVRGSIADNSNYPAIELQGGTLYQAGRAPKLALGNAGLGVGLYGGYLASTFTAQYGVYLDSSSGLLLQSSASGAPVTKLSLGTGDDVTISLGNLVIGTSGKGIDFSATPGTGTSELLADYEEGTWTPVLTGFSGSSGITFSTQKGGYVKVGKQVTVNCSLTLSAKTSITGIVVINGLPFTAGTAGGSVGFALGYWQNFATTFASITGYIDASTTRVVLGGQAVSGSSFAFMGDANIASNTTINFAATYLVD